MLRFLEAHRLALHRLVAALERPHAAYLQTELDRVKADLERLEHASMRANPATALAEEGEKLAPAVRRALPARFARGLTETQMVTYGRMRADQPGLLDTDHPRLRFWAQLRALRTVIEEIGVTLDHAARGTEAELRRQWAGFLGKRRDDLARYIAARPRTKLPAWLTVGGIVAPVVSVVLDQFGNWIWIQVAESLAG